MQNFGAIRKFSNSYFDETLNDKSQTLEALCLRFDLSFQDAIFPVFLNWESNDLELLREGKLGLPKFNLVGGQPELSQIIDGFLNFSEQYGLKAFFTTEMSELESYLREQNHVRVLEKKNLHILAELHYNFQLLLEETLTRFVSQAVAKDEQKFVKSRDLETTFNNKLAGLVGASIEVLDQDKTTTTFRYQPALEDNNWKKLWDEVIQKLANNLDENNARQWVDKPWQ